MHRTLLAVAAALALTACAERAPATLSAAQLGAASNDAMVIVCQRKRAGQSEMTPAWETYCRGRGL